MVFNEELKVVITLMNGNTVTLYNENINALTITQQALSSGFDLGGVNTGQLNATLKISGVQAGQLFASIIKIFKKSNNEWKAIGVFNTTSAKAYHDMITISASDNVIWFNKESYSVDEYAHKVNNVANWLKTERTLYQVLKYVVEDMGGLTLAQTQAEIESMPNGTIHTIVFDDVKTDNLRDWLSWIAQTLAGFVYADGEGRIGIRQFELTPTARIPLNTIQNDSLTIADYKMVIAAVRMSEVWDGTFGAWWNPARDGKPNNVEIEVSDNWIIQGKHWLYNSESGGYAMDVLGDIYYAIVDLVYYPFMATVHSNNEYYIGQCVTIEDLDGNDVQTVISKRTYTLYGGQKIESNGIDTRVLSEQSQRTRWQRDAEKLRTEIENAKGKSVTQAELDAIVASKKYREGDVFYVYDTEDNN